MNCVSFPSFEFPSPPVERGVDTITKFQDKNEKFIKSYVKRKQI